MTKRIFRSICLAALVVLAASVGLIMGVVYDYFSGIQRQQLRTQTSLAAHGISNEGVSYFYGLDSDDFRVTWISPDGIVLYDTDYSADKMENHLEREEIKEALADGFGESSRYSTTLTERLYYAAERLPDGSVVRLAVARSSVLALMIGILRPICIVFVIAIVLSLVLASRLSKRIVKPLNDLDLENPLSNEDYDELSPLLRRIDSQQRQLRRQQADLKHRREEFSAVTGNMNEGLVLLGANGAILSMNPAAASLLQADGQCIGRNILTVNRTLEMQEIVRHAQCGERAERIISIGEGRYQLDASPIYSKEKVSGIVVLLFDVTQKERAEQMRREFTANVSHELKTPLHSISGYAELIAGGMVKQEDIGNFAGKIYAEARRMITLVEDIIRLSSLDEGAGDTTREPVDLYAAACDTAESLKEQAQEASVSLSLEGEPAVIDAIPRLVSGIVYNLCDNAVKYNKTGGSVRICVRNADDAAVLTVSDTGIGIEPAHQERIFERFYRVDKSRSKAVGGTGLGLSIVKHAARVLGAEIHLESRVGEGTTVTVRFPKKPPERSAMR